ncbi:serine/threonine-protein kinase [Demequina salsinemoris]|uniref:serine/threonine-protein kinase n=1 Tax=Demequina salsinemoris TaxID=577470 RepID=UPI00078114D8|nr:serine/threonine-protein kinase [Demequina salsinemoris]
MAGLRREVGDEIGGYVVRDTLGRGGSGAVYLVEDGGGQRAALKLVDAAEDPVAGERLAREVRALQSLRHPAVPRVLDAEVDGDETFVVSEYIPGLSLFDHVQQHGPLAGAALADLAERIASALEAAHAAGVVHRDVTPANVMMGPHGPVLIDFGLAHREDDQRLTREGLVSGTAGYVAPEVIDGVEPGPVADLWAWAATVAYAMTGRAPFGTGAGAVSRTLEGHVDLPHRPGADALEAALGKDIDARPSPAQVVAALRGETQVLGVGAAALASTAVLPAMDDAGGASSDGAWEAQDDATAVLEPYSDDDTTVLEPFPAADDVDHDTDAEVADQHWDDEHWEDQHWDGPREHEGDLGDQDRASSSLALEEPPTPGRPVMMALGALAVGAGAALAPVVVFLGMVATAIVARGVHRRAASLAASRARRGKRRGDAVVHTIGMPWHLLRGILELVPSVLLSALVGVGAGALMWWLASSELIASGTEAGQAWGHAGAIAFGALAAAGTMWVGPWSEGTRDGSRRLAYGLAPTTGVAAAWVVVSIIAIGVVIVAVYMRAEPWWWPVSEVSGWTWSLADLPSLR